MDLIRVWIGSSGKRRKRDPVQDSRTTMPDLAMFFLAWKEHGTQE